MSHAYNQRKKNKWKNGLELLKAGKIPEVLARDYPTIPADKLLEVWQARRDLKGMIKRHIRSGTASRFVLAKDNQGRPLFRCWKKCKGIYKSKDGTTIPVGQFLIQRSQEWEMRRSFGDKK